MLSILRNRRSARDFEEKAIEEEKVKVLKEAILRSPSSRSFNPWKFIFVDDTETLRALGRCKEHGAAFLSQAPLAVVVLGNTRKSDTCVEDCSIAAITLQYAAESFGLQSCWCQVRMRPHSEDRPADEYVKELLGIPGHYLVVCVIGIGYPVKSKPPHDLESLDWEKIHINKY